MISNYFENELVKLHYYKFGSGPKPMLCFHGYGMHGKQFKIFEDQTIASRYTFYGFDLFFHKQTLLKDQSLSVIKKGISKAGFAELIAAFCASEYIDRFSMIAYSMGTHYATAIAEEMPERIDEYIVIAPSALKPGMLVNYFSKSRTGNKILEKLATSKRALLNMLKLGKRLRFLDAVGYDILSKEFGTDELRFNFYACFTYLRFFETDNARLLSALNNYPIKCIFIFGKRDAMYPPKIGKKFIPKLKHSEIIILDENHEMINQHFVDQLTIALG